MWNQIQPICVRRGTYGIGNGDLGLGLQIEIVDLNLRLGIWSFQGLVLGIMDRGLVMGIGISGWDWKLG